MKLQTQIPLQPQQLHHINYDSQILLLGSCFSNNIGDKLAYFKFQHVVNPFGIVFHTKAIENLVLNAINEKKYTEDSIFFHNDRWHSFEAHSSLSNSNKDTLLQELNESVQILNEQLINASHISITLGTSWVYRYIESDEIVSNCHKVPQKKFLKELLSVDEISASLAAIISLIRSVNTKASIVFTVSPIRHLKDGYIENTQSKAHLIAAIHEVVEPRKNLHYFPSYEILMDELRDYRFYANDMIHPNQLAIDYVWERFQFVWLSETTKATMQEIEVIQKGLSHKAFNEDSEQHQRFIEDLNDKIKVIEKRVPHINFDPSR